MRSSIELSTCTRPDFLVFSCAGLEFSGTGSVGLVYIGRNVPLRGRLLRSQGHPKRILNEIDSAVGTRFEILGRRITVELMKAIICVIVREMRSPLAGSSNESGPNPSSAQQPIRRK